MKYKTRKLVFTITAAILVCLLPTCVPLGPPDDLIEDETWTDVEYSPDGSSVTIYLDGSMPVRQSRALNLEWAKHGHDLFEVAFVYNHGSQYTVARSVWETGGATGVKGVYRPESGVDYSQVRNVAGMGVTQGSAILFVGKKSDRTLLAVGTLTHVNGEPGGIVKADSRTVTFSVAALKAGVNNSADISSFRTDALGPPIGEGEHTEIIPVTIGIKNFPLFWLAPSNGDVHGEYTFGVNTGNFDLDYKPGILLQTHTQASVVIYQPGPNPPSTAPTTPRIPRYPAGEETWETSMTGAQELPVDTNTQVTAVNNVYTATIVPAPVFENPVQFTISRTDGANNNGRVFAFSFEIPVIPLTAIDGRATLWSWYLRPGYDSYKYDLDDGSGSGGAILLGTGNFERSNSDLYVRKQPDKTRYPGRSAPVPSSYWLFDTAGIEIYLNRGNQTYNALTLPYLTYYVLGSGPTRISIISGLTNLQTELEASSNGILRIRLECYDNTKLGNQGDPFPSGGGAYNTDYDGDPPFIGELLIYHIPVPAGLDFENIRGRYVIPNTGAWYDFQNSGINADGGEGTYIVVFFENINIGASLNIPAGRNIILLAGRPNIVIGKGGTPTLAQVFNDQSTTGAPNIYYFGVWPFDQILAVQGMAVNSERFIINAGGTYNDVNTTVNPPTAPTSTGTFISGANAVIHHSGVTVVGTLR